MNNQNPLQSNEIEALVADSKSGNAEAFGKLYDIFVKPIYRYIYYRVGYQEAEDLTELVFLKTWENIGQYRPDQKKFSSWIFRIAHNLIVDFYRLHRQHEELVENVEDERRESHASFRANLNFDKEMLGVALGKLKDAYRQVLVLKYINDFSNEEISEIMDRSQAALRILQFRALKHLKRVLEEMGIGENEM